MKRKINIDSIALSILFLMLLLFATWQSCAAQLEGHNLYKVVHVTGQVEVQGTTSSLVQILGQYGNESQQPNDLVSVIDLNGDGVVNQAELTTLLGQWGNVLWDQGNCQESVYICFLLSFPGTYAGTSWFPGQPFKMIQTTSAQWWWVEQ